MNKLTPFSRNGFPKKSKSSYFDLVDNFFNDDFFSRDIQNDTFKIDIEENDNNYVIEAEVPGLEKNQVVVKYENNQLVISIKYEDKIDEEDKNYIHKERRTCSMSRSIRLTDIDKDQINAKLVDGILKITAPKTSNPTKNSNTIEIE